MKKSIFICLFIMVYHASLFSKDISLRMIHRSYGYEQNDTPLVLVATDKRTGVLLKPTLSIKHIKSNSSILIKEQGDQYIANVTKGESYLIRAELEGYYTIEKNYDVLTDDPTFEFQMDPRPSAVVMLKALNDANEAIDATFKISMGNDIIHTGKSKGKQPYKVFLLSSEEYKIEVSANNYPTIIKKQHFEVGDPPHLYDLEPFKLSKPENIAKPTESSLKVNIIGADNKLLKGAKIVLTNSTDGQVILDKKLTDASTLINGILSNKKYTLSIEHEGYAKYDETAIKNDTKELNVRLTPETFLLLGAFDAISKKRIPAIIRLKPPKTGEYKEFKGLVDDDISYKPTATGTYEIEMSLNGYKTLSESIKVNSLFGDKIIVNKNLEIEQEEIIFRVIDDKKNTVANAELTLFGKNNKAVKIKKDAASSTWAAMLNNSENYSLEIDAFGFEPYKEPVKKDKYQEILLTSIANHQMVFTAIDALTKKSIEAEFKLSNNKNKGSGLSFTAEIFDNTDYELEVSAKGFSTFKEPLQKQYIIAGKMVAELKKNTYTFKFKPIDAQTKVFIPKTTFKCESLAGEGVKSKYIAESNENQVELANGTKYSIEYKVDNYKTIVQSVDVETAAAANDFIRELPMEKIIEPIPAKEQVVAMKPIVKEIPVIKEEPLKKEIPKKVEKLSEEPLLIIDNPDAALIENLKIGQRFRLANLLFEQSVPILKPSSFPQLNKLLKYLVQNPTLKIEIIGHTDNQGDSRQNLYLSDMRAKYVASYFSNRGVAENRIKYFGLGSAEPIAPNDTEENMKKNRRVEFTIWDN